MKRLFQITTLVVSVAAFSQPAVQVVTVNTEDAMAYVSWAQSAAPVFAKINDLPGAIGTCLPGAGAEEEGDAYWWSLAPSHASLLTGSPRDPAVLKEVEKVEDIRTVRERDIWSVVKSSDRVLAAIPMQRGISSLKPIRQLNTSRYSILWKPRITVTALTMSTLLLIA